MARPARRRAHGFTLIELLVAVGILALMAVLSWRGLDGMARTQSRLQERADAVLALQAGLAQWGADLDALLALPALPALDWDGRALRLTRRASTAGAATATTGLADEGLVVVAWSRREVDGGGQWLRWQSPALRTRGDVQAAWAQAAQWAQNPGDDLKAREVPVLPLAQWQIFYFRGDAWTNPLSAVGNTAGPAAAGGAVGGAVGSVAAAESGAANGLASAAGGGAANGVAGGGLAGGLSGAVSGAVSAALARGVAALAAGLPGTTNAVDASVPQGVRLVLTLPPGQAISGTLTRDWVVPTWGGGKS